MQNMKKKILLTLFVFTAILNSCKQSEPEDVLGRIGDVVEFSGYKWDVKQNEYLVGPGPNYFSGYYSDVFTDENGYLHLRIAEHDGKWYSTEVVTQDNLGYGKYVFVTQADLENIPENTVLGLFTWDNNSFYENANSEVDIEFSKWGNIENEYTMNYSVQPVNFGTYYSERTYNAPNNPGELVGISTHVFTWTDTLITWQSYKGDSEAADDLIAEWSFDLDNPGRVKTENGNSSAPIIIPAPGATTNARINFWILPWVNEAPTDGLEQEVVIRKFSYTPI